MASKLKAYVRFDGSGRIIPSSVILQRFKPAVGNWKEIDANECCNVQPPQPTNALKLTFNNFNNLELLGITNPTEVSQWNTILDLPTNGNPFTSVTVSGFTVSLYGGSNISLNTGLTGDDNAPEPISIIDEINCIVELKNSALDSVENLSVLYLPACVIVNSYSLAYAFRNFGASEIYLPSLINMGLTVGDNSVFDDNVIIGKTITLTIPAALMTCNGGNPDGDIQYLQANNTVTIITV